MSYAGGAKSMREAELFKTWYGLRRSNYEVPIGAADLKKMRQSLPFACACLWQLFSCVFLHFHPFW